MKRIDGKYAVDGKFVDRDAAKGIPGTQTKAEWFNDVQEEIANTIEDSGQTLDGGNDMQLFSAIQRIGAMCQSKVEFDANREMNKDKYAGSGFVEWGKQYTSTGGAAINEGMWQLLAHTADMLYMGRSITQDSIGASKTLAPIVSVDGNVLYLNQINTESASTPVYIQFPAAPDGTKSYDSATGIVTDHLTALSDKYPDAEGNPTAAVDHNEAVSRCFEGLCTNGDFRLGTEGWGFLGLTGSVIDGKLTLTNPSDNNRATLKFNVARNTEYVLEVNVDPKCGYTPYISKSNNGTGSVPSTNTVYTTDNIKRTLTSRFNSGENDSLYFLFYIIASGSAKLSNISIRPATSAPILTRQDLSFLESWHEDTSEKGVLFPFGNVQYGATSWEGIPLKKLTELAVGQGYIAFGEWDKDTIGYGAKISEMTFAHLSKFCADPKNNVYFDAETGKLIQVRYRMRVVEGLGDDWDTPTPWYNIGRDFAYSDKKRVYTRGQLTDVIDLSPNNAIDYFNDAYSNVASTAISNVHKDVYDINRWCPRANATRAFAYHNKCYALPIALVQRMNQGAYHPVYNPSGTGKFSNRVSSGIVLDDTNIWYESYFSESLVPKDAKDCFVITGGTNVNIPGIYPAQGGIADARTGRPTNDPYKYYDAIYAGQIKDLRLSAHKQDVNKLRVDAMRKAVAGKMRGWGKVPFTTFNQNVLIGYLNAENSAHTRFSSKPNDVSENNIIDTHGNGLPTGTGVMLWCLERNLTFYGVVSNVDGHFRLTQSINNLGNPSSANHTTSLTRSDKVYIAKVEWLTPQNDTLSWTDIIGSPENIAATFPNGVVGQWIPQIPDGTSKEYIYNNKCSITGNNVEATTTGNNGISWATGIGEINSVKNSRIAGYTASEISLHQYTTLSNFTEFMSNSKIVGDVGDVFATCSSYINSGNRLNGSLTGNNGMNDQSTSHNSCNLLTNYVNGDGELTRQVLPTHMAIDISEKNNSIAVKALSTITEKDGLLYLQYHGSELKYDTDAANWGDKSTIPVVWVEDTMTDLNGNTVETFCHHSMMPIGIASN